MDTIDDHIRKLDQVARDLKSAISHISDDSDYDESRIRRVHSDLEAPIRRLKDWSHSSNR